ncbi:MAG: hypothetical protein COZ25_13930, partial [Ignavibacteria bacterium CG_4_10_14_3_um_filter_37_18]
SAFKGSSIFCLLFLAGKLKTVQQMNEQCAKRSFRMINLAGCILIKIIYARKFLVSPAKFILNFPIVKKLKKP